MFLTTKWALPTFYIEVCMKDKIKGLVDSQIENLNLWVDDAFIEERDTNKFFCVVLDSEKLIDIEKLALASRIIDPLIEELDLIKDAYILDIYAKSKGEMKDEQ